MKTMQTINFFKIISFATLVCIFSSCNQLDLSIPDAKVLVTNALNLPQKFRKDIDPTTEEFKDGNINEELIKRGFIERVGDNMWSGLYGSGTTFKITEKGQPYYLGESKTNNRTTYGFRTFDIDLLMLEGVSINKEQQTAAVKFTLIGTNVTPIGEIIDNNMHSTKAGELIFKKFDTGWQLASDQNKTSSELVRQICWGR